MINIGPIIFGFLIGFIVSTRLQTNNEININLTYSSLLLILVFGFFISWQLGQFPYYNDLPIASGFFSSIIGLLLGNIIFNNSKN